MKKEPNKRKNYLVPFLFAIYIALLVWIILLKLQFSISDLDTIRKINLMPFYYDNGIGIEFHLKEVMENIVVFIPFGIYLSMINNVRTQVSVDDNLFVMGDPEKLARVFNNLLKNAVAYSYPNTEISISAEKKDNDIIVVFKNYGVTIPAEQLSTIFEKFNRLDSARASNTGGAGLGLSIAKEIINLHGGKIIAKSSNETIVFIITLPCSS